MNEQPALRAAERRYAWALAIIDGLIALIAQLTRPSTEDIDGFIGALGLVFWLG